MILNNAEIVACPFCGKKKELLSIVSGNTFGSILWSDGKQISPMLPKVSPVQKCPRCRKYYLYYNQPTQTADHESFTTGNLSYLEWKEAYVQFIAEPTLEDHDKSVIYMHLIQAFNDHYYRGPAPAIYTKESVPPEEECRYIERIISEFINSTGWKYNNSLLLKAELYREMGDFAQCKKTLNTIDISCLDNFERNIIKGIIQRAEAGDKTVFKIE